MRKHTWHGELKYSMKLNQGCTKNEDKYLEGTNGRSMGGYVMDHNTTRKWETIRHNKSESYWTKYLETGLKDSMWNMDWRFWECRNCWKCMEVCKDVQRVGNRVAEVGLEYFCPDYVSKNGVSVMEHNSIPPSRTSSWGPIEFHGKFGLRSKFGHCWYNAGAIHGKCISSFCSAMSLHQEKSNETVTPVPDV